MRYRTKLLLVFLAVALVTNGISLIVLDRLALYYLYEGYRAKMLSITASTAVLLDGDLLSQVQSRTDENSPAYRQLRDTLRRVRDANRRPDTNMKRVFSVMAEPGDPKTLLVGVDPEEDKQVAAHPGEAYRSGQMSPIDMEKTEVGQEFIADEFGTFLRAHAPVRNRAGKTVGAVVVEASSDWVAAKMLPIRLSSLFAMLLASLLAIPAALYMSRRTSRPLTELHAAVDRIGQGDFDTLLAVRSRDEFGMVALAVNTMAAGLKERDRVKATFAHYVSQQVMDSILKSGAELKLSGDRRRISVLFCDIRGFSTMSEKLPPEKVVALLNDYFEAMVEVIFRNHGTLDKFIGDGVMVIFGAPEDDQNQEEHALRTAIEMQRELRHLAGRWEAEGIDVRIGVGINSGPAVVGNIGSARRMDYTAIGDTVNLASRLESATKELGVGILVSEYTYNALRGIFRFREMGPVQVRGRSEAVLTYTPIDEDEAV
ncbi:MAG: adenylate/guanylate cyclase domain-containing protein [Acidobacteriota bacterium]